MNKVFGGVTICTYVAGFAVSRAWYANELSFDYLLY